MQNSRYTNLSADQLCGSLDRARDTSRTCHEGARNHVVDLVPLGEIRLFNIPQSLVDTIYAQPFSNFISKYTMLCIKCFVYQVILCLTVKNWQGETIMRKSLLSTRFLVIVSIYYLHPYPLTRRTHGEDNSVYHVAPRHSIWPSSPPPPPDEENSRWG